MLETGNNLETERAEAWELLETEMFAPFFENDEQKEQFLQECFDGTRKFPWHLQGQSIGVTNSKAAIAAIDAGGLPVLGGTLIGRPEYETRDLTGMNVEQRMELGHSLNKKKLLEEVDTVREAHPHAIFGVNILNAIEDFEPLVRALGETGKVDVIYVGAGLPFDMSQIMEDYPNMRYMAIVSSGLAVRMLERRGSGECRPNGYVYEDGVAAGHNAPERRVKEGETKPTAKNHISDMKEYANGKPIIMAGGIRNQEDIKNAVLPEELGGLDTNGIGLGTRGLLTQESGVDNEKMKRVHLNPDIPVERYEKFSPTGLPSTGKLDPNFLKEANLRRIEVLQKCNNCLGDKCKFLETGGKSEEYPFCIGVSLAEELNGGDYGVSFMGEIDETEKLYSNGVPTLKEAVEYTILDEKKTVEDVQPLISDVFSNKKIA